MRDDDQRPTKVPSGLAMKPTVSGRKALNLPSCMAP